MPLRTRTTEPPLSVGNTPLLELTRLSPALGERVRLFAKAEWHNPGGSVKDRPALRMVQEGRRSGRFRDGQTLLDATSGNTGIAYAWIGAQLGFKVALCVPKSINPERRKVLEAYGVELIMTDPLLGSDGAILEARKRAAADPGRYFYPDQYNNPENWKAHYETTAPELWAQTKGALTHFVAGLGTSGTFTGTGRRLREYNPGIRLVSVQPDSPMHGLEGLKHMETAIVPGIYDPALADEAVEVATEDAQKTVLRMASVEGVLAGPSGGANVFAALRLAETLAAAGRDAVIATLLPDSGERYLAEPFWKEAP